MTKIRNSICSIVLLLTVARYGAAQVQPGAGGTTDTFALDRLRNARSLWLSSGPSSYVMRMQRTCFCFGGFAGPFLVTVDNGLVTDVKFAPGGPTGTPSPDIVNGIPTVEGLFDIIEDALLSNAEFVTVSYDPANGAPVDFFIDQSSLIADEEIGYTIEFVSSGTPATILDAKNALNAARALWAATRPYSYSMQISKSSFLGYESFIITVEGDKVVSVEYAPDAPVPAGSTVPVDVLPLTVDGLFAEIDFAIRNGAQVIDVSYNALTGVPETVSIDQDQQALDGGVYYKAQLL